MLCDLLDQRHEGQVEEHVAVLGVIDDVADLLGKQARVHGVADGTHTGHRVVRFEVAKAVPRQRADAIVHLDAEALQCICELTGAPMRLRVRIAMNAALDHPRYDLGVAVPALRVPDQRRDLQRHVHHRALHGGPPKTL
jgi:hypothetical protein